MAGITAKARCTSAMSVILVVVLLFAPLAAARPVASGWDLSMSAGSSDTVLWRKFTTPAQATSFHRLLLDLEHTRMTEQVEGTAEVKVADPFPVDDFKPVDDFNTMDYANPRSNEPGSSDSSTPPTP